VHPEGGARSRRDQGRGAARRGGQRAGRMRRRGLFWPSARSQGEEARPRHLGVRAVARGGGAGSLSLSLSLSRMGRRTAGPARWEPEGSCSRPKALGRSRAEDARVRRSGSRAEPMESSRGRPRSRAWQAGDRCGADLVRICKGWQTGDQLGFPMGERSFPSQNA
jgi:hypothetical protein